MTLMHQRTRWVFALMLAPLLLGVQQADTAAQGPAPADIRALLEGTFELVEWHLDGQVLRPPEVGGRWSNHDGVVVAIYHRSGMKGFESFAGYGTYKMDASTWSYGYERVETANGPLVEQAKVTVRPAAPANTFKMSREGAKVVLERPNDRREYDSTSFTFMPNGRTLRKYRRVN